MEILEEFDQATPLYVSFCRRISPEDFEKQSLIYTNESLQDLFTAIDQNPRICEPIVRKKKKQQDEEGAGFASYLKAKLFSMFNYAAPVQMEDIQEEAEHLKREMRKARDYAVEARRVPLWLLERRECTTQTSGQARVTTVTAAVTAVPPMPKIFGPYPTQVDTGSKLPQPGLLPVQRATTTSSLSAEPSQSPSPSPGSSPPAPSGPRTGEEGEEDGNHNGNQGSGSHPSPAA